MWIQFRASWRLRALSVDLENVFMVEDVDSKVASWFNVHSGHVTLVHDGFILCHGQALGHYGIHGGNHVLVVLSPADMAMKLGTNSANWGHPVSYDGFPPFVPPVASAEDSTDSGNDVIAGTSRPSPALEHQLETNPKLHIGPVPGVHVGQAWETRMLCYSSGVHLATVAGIVGMARFGATSIVISDGYDENWDHGDTFTYVGCGGRRNESVKGNLKNKFATQDQELTGRNAALAKTCDASLSETGATAVNWRNSRPIRVVRGCKAAFVGKPQNGYRYDGIYKLCRYYPAKGRDGFKVFLYEFCRDDREPGPYTPEGIARIAELGLTMVMVTEEKIVKKRKRLDGVEEENQPVRDSASTGVPSLFEAITYLPPSQIVPNQASAVPEPPSDQLMLDCLMTSTGVLNPTADHQFDPKALAL